MATGTMHLSHPRTDEPTASEGRFQRAYTMKMAVTMGLYAALFFVLAFCGPYLLPAVTLLTDAPLDDRHVAASQLLLLSDTVWVAIPVLVLGALLFSMLATRRVANALERIGQSAQTWALGRTTHRLHFRNADSLDDLEKVLNQGWIEIGQGIETVQQEMTSTRAALDGAIRSLPARGDGANDALQHLQLATASLDRMQTALRKWSV
jgi:HAMP domain-containing protein